MGARLVGAVIAYAADVPLRPNEFRLLVGMALTALDEPSEGRPARRYFDSREASALILGRRVPDEAAPDAPDFDAIDLERKAAFSAVRAAVDGLTKLEAIERRSAGSVRGRAVFQLVLDVERSKATAIFAKRASDGRRKSLSLERRKFLHGGIGNPYPLGTIKEPTGGISGTRSPDSTTSRDPVDKSIEREAS